MKSLTTSSKFCMRLNRTPAFWGLTWAIKPQAKPQSTGKRGISGVSQGLSSFQLLGPVLSPFEHETAACDRKQAQTNGGFWHGNAIVWQGD
jgi:hypothetical protein